MGRKYSIGSFSPTSFLSMSVTRQLFSIAALLTCSLLPYLLLCGGASEVGSDHLSILLTVPLSPLLRPSSIFRKLVGMTLLFTLTLIVFRQRNTPLFSSAAAFFSGTESGQIFHSFWPRQTPSSSRVV